MYVSDEGRDAVRGASITGTHYGDTIGVRGHIRKGPHRTGGRQEHRWAWEEFLLQQATLLTPGHKRGQPREQKLHLVKGNSVTNFCFLLATLSLQVQRRA